MLYTSYRGSPNRSTASFTFCHRLSSNTAVCTVRRQYFSVYSLLFIFVKIAFFSDQCLISFCHFEAILFLLLFLCFPACLFLFFFYREGNSKIMGAFLARSAKVAERAIYFHNISGLQCTHSVFKKEDFYKLHRKPSHLFKQLSTATVLLHIENISPTFSAYCYGHRL